MGTVLLANGNPMTNQPTEDDWENNKERITALYSRHGQKLEDVMVIMAQEQGFVAPAKIYKKKLKQWRVGKYANGREYLFIGRSLIQQREDNVSNPAVWFHNIVRRPSDVKRHCRIKGMTMEEFENQARAVVGPAPDYIRPYHDANESMASASTASAHSTQVHQPHATLYDTTAEDMHDGSADDTLQNSMPTLEQEDPQRTSPGGGLASTMTPTVPLEGPWPSTNGHEHHDVFIQQGTKLSTTNNSHILRQRQVESGMTGQRPMGPTTDHINDTASVSTMPGLSVQQWLSEKYADEQPIREHEFTFTERASSLDHDTSMDLTTSYQTEDPEDVYVASCEIAALNAMLRNRRNMNNAIKNASTAFRRMCRAGHPMLLVVACRMLTWLILHIDGSLAGKVMDASFAAAVDDLGAESPISQLLEWMTAVVRADNDVGSMQSCRIDAVILDQIAQAFRESLGDAHGHSIVAVYCQAFHMMFVNKLYQDAERLLSDLWETSVRNFGESHVMSINILAAVSRAQLRQGKHVTALLTIERCLDKAPLGLSHPHGLELLVRKAVICWKMKRFAEAEELYWIVTRGRVAALGRQHRSTLAAHDSLEHALRKTGSWEARKSDFHALLTGPQLSVSTSDTWWRDGVDAHRQHRLDSGAIMSDGDE